MNTTGFDDIDAKVPDTAEDTRQGSKRRQFGKKGKRKVEALSVSRVEQDDGDDDRERDNDNENGHDSEHSIDDGDLEVYMNKTKKKEDAEPGDDSDEYEPRRNKPKRRGRKQDGDRQTAEEEEEEEEEDGEEEDGDEEAEEEEENGDEDDGRRAMAKRSQGQALMSPRRMNYTERLQLKAQILAKLERKQRFSGMKFDIPKDATLKQLQLLEYKVTYESRATQAVKNYQRILIMVVGMWEGLNSRYPVLGLDLQDYAEQVYLTIDQFDEDLYDLYDEWGSKRRGHPLTRVIMSILTGSVAYSMTRKMMVANGTAQPNPSLRQYRAGIHVGSGGGDGIGVPISGTAAITQDLRIQQQQSSVDNEHRMISGTSVESLKQRYASAFGSDRSSTFSSSSVLGRGRQTDGLFESKQSAGSRAPQLQQRPPSPIRDGPLMNDDTEEFADDIAGPPVHLIQKLRRDEDAHQRKQGKEQPVNSVVAELSQSTTTAESKSVEEEHREVPVDAPTTRRRRKRRNGKDEVAEIDKMDESYGN